MTFRADLAGIPEQLEALLPLEGGAVTGDTPLIIGGMGGSAAAGDFFALYLEGRRDARVLREPVLPERRDPRATLIVLSYSGETDESLALWSQARETGLRRALVTSGGALWRRAEAESCPRVMLPGGLAPRNAMGYLLGGLRRLTDSADSEFTEASRHLASIRARFEKQDAALTEIVGLLEAAPLPVLLAGDAFALCAARRWRASLAENAKVAATVWEMPEAAHNRIESVGRNGTRRSSLGLLALGIPREARARERWEAVLLALEAHGAKALRVHVPHAVPWIEALGLAYFGDWMSLQLAERLGVDPEPLHLMTDVKSRLRQGKESAS
jgi:glucose/mannose-6-phosphate isomerase